MSVLITGMEMPTNCRCCNLGLHCPKMQFEDSNRPDDCPLVEVPTPHGRLNDADAHTCADCKHFCFTDTRVGAHFMQKERYGYCMEYNLFPVFPSVVFCPKYEKED